MAHPMYVQNSLRGFPEGKPRIFFERPADAAPA